MIVQRAIYKITILSIISIFNLAVQGQSAATNPVDLISLGRALESLAERMRPAVVQIHTTGYSMGSNGSTDLLSRQSSGGSGVLLSGDGYIVTNAHVVDGARRIQVILSDPNAPGSPGQSVLKAAGRLVGAQLVGMDHATDIAVLKIAGDNLPFIKFADSEGLRAGQPVMAFGSPLGLQNTVTFGVVSAVARQLEPDATMIYVQTDAPINPGNSGGPLVNMQGQLVGINTFIISQSGGNDGLGFAAPSNIVRNVFEQIRATGRMKRGVIGINAQTITPMLAKGLGLASTWGVIVGDVYPNGPAHTMGIEPGDVILSLNGKTMENGRQLQVNLYSRRIGESVDLVIMRNGRPKTVRVPVTEQPDDPGRFAEMVSPEENLVAKLGILALDYDEEFKNMIPFLREESGVVVAARSSGGPPGSTGLFPGDIIHGINAQPIADLRQLRERVSVLSVLDSAVLHVERMGRFMYVVVEVE